MSVSIDAGDTAIENKKFVEYDRLMYSANKELFFFRTLNQTKMSLTTIHDLWPRHIMFNILLFDDLFFNNIKMMNLSKLSKYSGEWKKIFDLEVFYLDLMAQKELSPELFERVEKLLTQNKHSKSWSKDKYTNLRKTLAVSLYLEFRYAVSTRLMASEVQKNRRQKEQRKTLNIGRESINFSKKRFELHSFF